MSQGGQSGGGQQQYADYSQYVKGQGHKAMDFKEFMDFKKYMGSKAGPRPNLKKLYIV